LIESEPCPNCGVPRYISSEHQWLDNGDIVQRREPWHRMVFVECENFDPLFRGIEEIIGISIELIVHTAQRRAVRLYLSQFITDETRELIRMKRIKLKPLAEATNDIAKLMGFGHYEYEDMRYELDEDDYYTIRITEPFSLPMTVAAFVADIEALTDRDQGARCEKMSEGVYRITAFPSEHPQELKKRMWLEYYHHQKGDLELERCPACGCPKQLSQYRWDLERGAIENKSTKRRMIILGYQNLDPIFRELEAELGAEVSRAVVEAQRRFTKTGFYAFGNLDDASAFRNQLALRGLGNLKEMSLSEEGLSLRLANAVLPWIIVGLAQGLYDLHGGSDSSVEWESSEQGDLLVEVRSKK
jgi:hypothetical protein